MGATSEGTQSVDIDWNDYYTYTDDWGDRWVEHDVSKCGWSGHYIYSLTEVIDLVKEHHEICPLNN